MDLSIMESAPDASIPKQSDDAAQAEDVTDPPDQLCLNRSSKKDNPAQSEADAPQINIVPPSSLPEFKLEIDNQVYAISGVSIAISAEGGAADVCISLNVGPPKAEGTTKRDSSSDVTDVVRSIGSSLRSSTRAFVGAASKLFKPSGGQKSLQVGGNGSKSLEGDHQSASPSADNDQVEGNAASVEPTDSVRPESGASGVRDTRSQDNTLCSDSDFQPQQTVGGSLDDTRQDTAKRSTADSNVAVKTKSLRQMFNISNKPQSSREAHKAARTLPPVTVSFPECMPPKVKLFYQVKQDTRLIATVYAADTSSIAEELNQARKAILQDQAKRKHKINGKMQSVWLCPAAGEKVEIWKLYYDPDNRCNMVLGRLPGSELYGYVLPREIDRVKQFDSPAEQIAYEKAVRSLAFFDQDEYEIEEERVQEDPEEEPNEVYI